MNGNNLRIRMQLLEIEFNISGRKSPAGNRSAIHIPRGLTQRFHQMIIQIQ